MKKILIILTVLISCLGFSQIDTLNYIKQFETNKAQYIGKPFSVLLADMKQIQPKTVWPLRHGRYKTFILGNSFKFVEMDFSFNNVVTLSITGQDTIPIEQFNYYGKKNNYFFTQDEKLFYGNKIIKNIKVYR